MLVKNYESSTFRLLFKKRERKYSTFDSGRDKKNELCEEYKNLQNIDITTELQNQIEARYIFEPKIAVLATKRITKKDLNPGKSLLLIELLEKRYF